MLDEWKGLVDGKVLKGLGGCWRTGHGIITTITTVTKDTKTAFVTVVMRP